MLISSHFLTGRLFVPSGATSTAKALSGNVSKSQYTRRGRSEQGD